MRRIPICRLALSAAATLPLTAAAVISPTAERPLASCDAAVSTELGSVRIVDTFYRRAADGGHEVYLNLEQFGRLGTVLRRAACRTSSSGHRVHELQIDSGRWVEALPD